MQISQKTFLSQNIIEQINNGEPKLTLLKKENKLFRIRTASDVLADAEKQPDPSELFQNLIYEHEIIICFADTGVGKTIQAVQMASHISQKIITLYLDLELSDKQFAKRYKDDQGQLYQFPPNFHRADICRDFDIPKGKKYEEFFIEAVTDALELTGAKFVVIDNLTKLIEGDTDSSKNAVPLISKLAKLKKQYGLTLLILEHNKKVDISRPIQLNDLQGSKMKANLVDSIFSIGKCSYDKNLRYIKQLKTRSSEIAYDTKNVLVCELIKEDGFLHLKPIEKTDEVEMLRMVRTAESADSGTQKHFRTSMIMQLHQEGKSNREVSRLMGVDEKTVRITINNNNNNNNTLSP